MNVVMLCGSLSSDPVIRQLPSGETLISLQVTTVTPDGRRSVPVSAADTEQLNALVAGDEIAVLGSVERRFFRAGGATRSATEVKARSVVSLGDRRAVRRLTRQALLAIDPNGAG
ncbi:MAG TPA: single-stranded DNA-binding protein [Ilumatobacteraceae bacterium]|nr:single-stranded DNA-binding protein [Ilumatobacteraceae bacterium]